VTIKCQTAVEKEDMVSARVMIARPAMEDTRRKRGHAWRAKKTKGAPRYIIPEAEVPIMAMPDFSEEKRGRLL
jgi:hypothetical protein